MSIEEAAYNAAQMSEELPPIVEEFEATEKIDPEKSTGGIWDRDISFNWIKAKTGPGFIDDYMEHPLNAKGSKGTAQILRGLTGMAGALDYALIDIGLGAVELTKEKRVVKGVGKGVSDGAFVVSE